MYKYLTQEELDFLKQYYPSKGAKFCSIKLNRSESSIRNICFRNGIKLSEEYKKYIYKLVGEKSSETKSKSNKIYKVNPAQFLSPNTPEVAYILGLLWADGHVRKSGYYHSIVISCLREDLLEIKNIFERTGDWRYYEQQAKDRRPQLQIQTSNKILVNFLQDNDYTAKSTASACKILSKIPEHLQHYWFRGLVDGDGCFYIKNNEKEITIASSYEQDWAYMEKISNFLNIEFKIEQKTQIQSGKLNKSSVFKIRKLESIKKFGDYIYKNYENDKMGFTRKYNKWLLIKNKFWASEFYKNKEYSFINVLTKEKVFMKKDEFLKYSGLNQSDWQNLTSSATFSVKGWDTLEKYMARNGKPYRLRRKILKSINDDQPYLKPCPSNSALPQSS